MAKIKRSWFGCFVVFVFFWLNEGMLKMLAWQKGGGGGAFQFCRK